MTTKPHTDPDLESAQDNLEFAQTNLPPAGTPYACSKCGFVKHKRGPLPRFSTTCPVKSCTGRLAPIKTV